MKVSLIAGGGNSGIERSAFEPAARQDRVEMTGNLLYYEGKVGGLAEDGKKGTSVVVGRAAGAGMYADRTAEAAVAVAVAGMTDMLWVYVV